MYYPNFGQQVQSQDQGECCEKRMHKKKPIQKSDKKGKDATHDEDSGSFERKYGKLPAKEIKRLREQNRRASHKEYVTGLENKLREKDSQVQILQNRIQSLSHKIAQIESKTTCKKCGEALGLIEKEEIEIALASSRKKLSVLEVDEEQSQSQERPLERVFIDEKSLRINFGNNFLFIAITLSCLLAGCIADNTDLTLEPIVPYKLKSQMCFLPEPSNLNKITFLKTVKSIIQLSYSRKYPERFYMEIERASEWMSGGEGFGLRMPSRNEIGAWIFSARGGLVSFMSSFMLQEFMNGYNYYI